MYANKEVSNLQLINTNTGEVLINTDFATVEGTVDHGNKEVTFKVGIPVIDEWIAIGYTLEEAEALVKLSEIDEQCNPVLYEELKAAMNRFDICETIDCYE